MEDVNAIAGVENSDPAASTGAMNPPVEEDDFEALGYPYASDPRDSEALEDEQSKTDEEDADKEDAASESEKTEEEKALEAELKALQDANPGKSPGSYLRRLAEGALKSKQAAEARVTELETELADATGVSFRPTVPAEEFKADDYWKDVITNHAAYYPAMAKDIIQTHLDPVRFRTEPGYAEAIMPVIQQVFVERWLPEFVQSEYGLDLPTYERITTAAIQAHLNGGAMPVFGTQTPTGFQPAATSGNTQTTEQQIKEKFGVEAEKEPELYNALKQGLDASVQIAAMQVAQANMLKQVEALKTAQGSGTKQQEEAAATARVAEFDSMVAADRQRQLDTALKAVPRDSNGRILKEYAHLPKKIERLAKVELGEDAGYGANHGHAQKWFKQPGNADSAKKLASADLKAIFAKHQAVISRIAAEELQPYVDKIRLSGQVQQQQRAQNPLKGGEGLSTPVPTNGQLPQRRRPETTAERASRLYDAAHQR